MLGVKRFTAYNEAVHAVKAGYVKFALIACGGFCFSRNYTYIISYKMDAIKLEKRFGWYSPRKTKPSFSTLKDGVV